MPQSFVITNECGDGSRVYKADSFFKAARKGELAIFSFDPPSALTRLAGHIKLACSSLCVLTPLSTSLFAAHRDNKCASQIVIKCVSSGECMAFELSSLRSVNPLRIYERNPKTSCSVWKVPFRTCFFSLLLSSTASPSRSRILSIAMSLAP